MSRTGRYRYVGDAALRRPPHEDMVVVRSRAALEAWLATRDRTEVTEPFTYVVDLTGVLRVAPRRSEHVAAAEGDDVLAAGEVTFGRDVGGWSVTEVSNHSTGYCPDLDSWEAVAIALDRVRLPRPRGFTNPVVFRRCPVCDEPNIVRDDDYVCALCDARLPRQWNFDEG
jgi:hypothetical protein